MELVQGRIKTQGSWKKNNRDEDQGRARRIEQAMKE